MLRDRCPRPARGRRSPYTPSRWIVASALFLALAAAASAQPTAPLNFVVVLTDDQRFDTMWAMPIVQQEHASRSVVFDEAVASTPLCCPFRASFLSGGYFAHRTGVIENAPPNGGAPGFFDVDTLPLRLQQAGYATALFGKYMNQYEDIAPYVPPGWTAFEAELSTSQSSSYQLAVGSSGASSSIGSIVTRSQFGTDYYRDRTLAFIQSHADEPFFVLMSVRAPHSPALPAPGDENLFSSYLFRGRGYGEDVSDKPARVQAAAAKFPSIAAQEDAFHRSQLRSLQAVDRAVGALYARLAQLDLLENTVVVFASDNGFLWGEHGMVGKGEIYEESLRVPLMIAAPGVTPRNDDHMVAVNLDLPATILELAGLAPVGDGLSLVPLLEGTSPPWRETLLIEAWNPTQAWSGLRIDDERGRWKYVENTRGFAELYDLDGDPFELSNLANQPSRAAFVSQLAAELAPQKGVASRTHSAPNGKPGTAYSRALLAWGGAPPYTWRLFQGMLPPGLRITSGANPLLSGTPTAPGTWSFVLEVRDTSTNTVRSGPQVYRQPLELRIVAVCEDGVDNDGDGRVDYPADPGCAGPLSMLENPQCDDRIDNDLDGGIDFAGTPPDPQCKASWRNQEQMSSCGLGFEIAFVLAPLALWRARRRRAFPAVVAAALAVAAAASPAGAAATYLFSFGSPQVPTPETFGWVTGVAVDSSTGDVFIPTEGPIRRFDDQGNFIVGFGSCQGCRGMDVDVVTHDLYAADGNSNRILQYTKEGQLVRQWGTTGTGNGQFASLYDVSIDAAGRRIFAIDGTRIQVFDLQGNFVRAWGSVGQGWGQFSGNATGQPYGVSYDPSSGTVWASDSFLDRIYAFDDVGNLLGGWDDNGGGHGPGQMRWVRNLDVDAVGNVYECDSDNERIQVFAPDGSFVDEFRGPHDLANGPFHPRGIAVNRTTGEKWVAAAYAQRVDKFDAANEYLFSLGDRQRDGMTMWVPLAIAVSPTTGDVFVDDKNNFLVKRFSRDGRFRTQWGGSVRLDPYSDGRFGYDARVLLHRAQTPLAVDPDGNLWVAGYGTRYLGDPHYHFARRLGPLGNFIDGWLPLVPVTEAYGELALGIAVDPVDRRVYISDGQTDRVRVHSTTGGVLRTISVPDPGGIAPAADGIYVVSAGTQTVRKYARNGTLLLQWGGPGIAPGKFDFLVGGIGAGIALDSTGKVYVADAENNRVQVFDPDGNFLEVIGSVGTTPGKFRTPYALAIAKDSDTLYVLDTGNTRVQAFALPTSPACFDGIDNDGDGKIDFTRDRGCANALSAIENPSCDDGYDNDGDGKIDFDGNPPDPDCTSASANREFRRACGLGFEVLLPLVPLAWCASRRRRPAAP